MILANETSFLSCDWGTSNFRLRLVRCADRQVLGEVRTADGVATLAGSAQPEVRASVYGPYLIARAQQLLDRSGAQVTNCVISGMASSRIGWRELPYATLPQALDGNCLVVGQMECGFDHDRRLQVHLISGVRDREDVMRGEETEAIGLASLVPALRTGRALLILPGTHSKHIDLCHGAICGFTTFMTGELFSHLRQMPTLRHVVSQANGIAPDSESFHAGVRSAHGGGFFRELFRIRARNLLESPGDEAAFLSGLLIGTELLQVERSPERPVWIGCAEPLAMLYRAASDELGLDGIQFAPTGLIENAVVEAHRMILERAANHRVSHPDPLRES